MSKRCQRCTKRHISCDKKQPCGSCQRSNVECTWDVKDNTFLFWSENSYVEGRPRLRGPRARKTNDLDPAIESDNLAKPLQRDGLCEKAWTEYERSHTDSVRDTISELDIEDLYMAHRSNWSDFPTLANCAMAIALAQLGHFEDSIAARETSWLWYHHVLKDMRYAVCNLEGEATDSLVLGVMMLSRLEDKLGLRGEDCKPGSLSHDKGALAMMSRWHPTSTFGTILHHLMRWRFTQLALVQRTKVPPEVKTSRCTLAQDMLNEFCSQVADKQIGEIVDCTALDEKCLNFLQGHAEYVSFEQDLATPAVPQLNNYPQQGYLTLRSALEWNIYRTAKLRLFEISFQEYKESGDVRIQETHQNANIIAREILMSVGYHLTSCNWHDDASPRSASAAGKLTYALLAVGWLSVVDVSHKVVARAALNRILQQTGNRALWQIVTNANFLRKVACRQYSLIDGSGEIEHGEQSIE